MLEATTMSGLAKALRENRNRTLFGGRIVSDDVFSKSSELIDIATRSAGAGTQVPIAQKHTWSLTEPIAPEQTTATTIASYLFDETSGVEAADQSANDNDLTVSGATWAAGKFNNCLSFDGVNDVATGGMESAEPVRNYLYGACWINPSSLTGTRPLWQIDFSVSVFMVAGVLTATLVFPAATYTVTSNLTAVTGAWQYVSFQFDTGVVMLGLGDLMYKETIATTTW